MRNRTLARSIAVAAVVATFLAAALMASAQETVGNGITPSSGSVSDPTAPDVKLPAKYAPLDTDSLIVFADAKTDDLWVTDADGSDFVRLTHTAVVESDPSAWFPWVVYEARDKDGNSDIYMTSMISKLELGSAGRIKISGNRSNDWDPTIVGLSESSPAPEEAAPIVGARASRRPELRSIFGDALIAYSSDRKEGNKKGCGVELFAEWFTVTGPVLVSECDGVDKYDPEFSLFGEYLAYTGIKNNGDTDVWVGGSLFAPMDPVKATGGPGDAEHPTWAPEALAASAARPEPHQPAGSFPITYTKFAASNDFVGELWTMGITDEKTLSSNADLLAPEWNALGEALLFIKAKGKNSRVAWWAGAGINEVTPDKFWATGADFMALTPAPPV